MAGDINSLNLLVFTAFDSGCKYMTLKINWITFDKSFVHGNIQFDMFKHTSIYDFFNQTHLTFKQ